MEEQIITLKTAKLAKEKNFSCDKTMAYYRIDKKPLLLCKESILNEYESEGDAPTQSHLQKWLRENYNINVIIYPIECFVNDKPKKCSNPEYTYQLIDEGIKTFVTRDKIYKTYEKALEIGLREGLNLI